MKVWILSVDTLDTYDVGEHDETVEAFLVESHARNVQERLNLIAGKWPSGEMKNPWHVWSMEVR